jgi:hypothetical protein
MVRHTLWIYDVLGNSEDGYEVNDRREICIIDIPADPSQWDVIEALYDNGEQTGFCNVGLKVCTGIEIGAEGEPIEITDEVNDRPVGQLVPVVG